MNDERTIYAAKAISQIPRLLSQLDRNPYSPTYGSFDRSYWHDKGSDFSNADQQLGALVLALVYSCDYPGNPYYGQAKIRDWAISGLDFLSRIQHADGSFDEHYPRERGWAGPTAFLVYYGGEALRILSDEMAELVRERVRHTIHRAALSIVKGQAEEDLLANHHALACLAVWSAYELLEDPALKNGFDRLWKGFLELHDAQEGWSMEYDGADPGYQSATVSFLAKLLELRTDPRLEDVVRQSIEFCSFFIYPDGTYGGSIGSRHTSHFYPHGFELMAKTNDLALAMASRMSKSLQEGKLVPPDIMSDRYIVLRMVEYLLAYKDSAVRTAKRSLLPCESGPFVRYFSNARLWVANHKNNYIVSNLGKGGVLKVFDRQRGRLILCDGGVLGKLKSNAVITSQWTNPAYQIQQTGQDWEVRGHLQQTPSQKPFTLVTHLLFRLALLTLGRSPAFSHWLKGRIRKIMMLDTKPIPFAFKRKMILNPDKLIIVDELKIVGRLTLTDLLIGDEFLVRHVPQSQYFQMHELETSAQRMSAEQLSDLNQKRELSIRREIRTV